MNTVSIIIPVYNEGATVGEVLRRVFSVKLDRWKRQVIVVDDGSTDKTPEVLASWQKKAIIVCMPLNQGKGAAVAQGLMRAHGEVILLQDADLEYNPSDYPKLLEPFADTRVTVVYGSRFLGPHLSTMYLYAMGNKFVTLVTNVLFNTNITDMETGYKAFRRGVVDDMTIHARRFDFEPEFTANVLKAGHQIYEVPISYFGRKFSEGKKLTWRDGVVALWTLLRCRLSE
ncbi:glycosyl transferase [Candidatus Gottesmanbacteria bacterium RIFCSPLOWO2_01_FULL_49_10]|uniref:Glycosyl transferase n=1 Tax=Candidatus Gottesmanbacteria bacterium RIFCSPLOWO2_01_FULL_49_10 TaxID=1798396 RepID=A0A1F6AWW5_9BACT|nr:MAG: Dolichyl-phosphate mannose synthase related protein [Microgenomates group bacterium GW2011_GWA2_47_8]OGG29118.1 MAG: glycosyl transferase [Candidatus Gottesmanbacteria bacterium RIFCSPLOWO2_01_FULL_49_10]